MGSFTPLESLVSGGQIVIIAFPFSSEEISVSSSSFCLDYHRISRLPTTEPESEGKVVRAQDCV